MANKSLEQLKRERDILLNKQNKNLRKNVAKNSLDNLARANALEEKKLKAEILALKNPGSLKAIKSLKKTSGRLGKFIKKRAIIMGENISAAAEGETRTRKPRAKLPRKKPTTRRPTPRRSVKRKPTPRRSVKRKPTPRRRVRSR